MMPDASSTGGGGGAGEKDAGAPVDGPPRLDAPAGATDFECGCEMKPFVGVVCVRCKLDQLCVQELRSPAQGGSSFSCVSPPPGCQPLSCACFGGDAGPPDPCPPENRCGVIAGMRAMCGT
jgi:hypothetical protein